MSITYFMHLKLNHSNIFKLANSAEGMEYIDCTSVERVSPTPFKVPFVAIKQSRPFQKIHVITYF